MAETKRRRKKTPSDLSQREIEVAVIAEDIRQTKRRRKKTLFEKNQRKIEEAVIAEDIRQTAFMSGSNPATPKVWNRHIRSATARAVLSRILLAHTPKTDDELGLPWYYGECFNFPVSQFAEEQCCDRSTIYRALRYLAKEIDVIDIKNGPKRFTDYYVRPVACLVRLKWKRLREISQ